MWGPQVAAGAGVFAMVGSREGKERGGEGNGDLFNGFLKEYLVMSNTHTHTIVCLAGPASIRN